MRKPSLLFAATATAAAFLGSETTAMPLQSPARAGDAGAQVNTSRNYSLPDDTTPGGRSGRPSTVPQWVRDQEVYMKRRGETTFTVTVENVSGPDAMRYEDGTGEAAGMSHGVYAVWDEYNPVIRPDDFTDLASGLEALAEDGNVRPLQAFLRSHRGALETGIFYKPVGASGDEELWPGKAYEFTVTANPGDKLSFVTMLMQSNDLVYAPEDGHLELFDGQGRPVTGDVSSRIVLYDVGTEANQHPRDGRDTGMNQSDLNTGPMEDDIVRPVDDGFPYPAPEEVLRVTVRAE